MASPDETASLIRGRSLNWSKTGCVAARLLTGSDRALSIWELLDLNFGWVIGYTEGSRGFPHVKRMPI